MAEKLQEPEASETSGVVAQEIGWVRWAMNSVVNGFNDGAEFVGTAGAYTAGRSIQTVKSMRDTWRQGMKKEAFGQAA